MRRPKSIALVGKRLLGRTRTDLYDWFWTHWDELPEYQPYRVDWPGMVQDLAALGLKGRDENKPLSIGVVRKTFFRVMQDKQAEAKPSERQPTPARQVMRDPLVHKAAPSAGDTEDDDEPAPTDTDDFRPAKIR